MARCIGLVGGLGVGAGIHYYKALAKAHEAAGMPLQLAMVHAQISRVFEDVRANDKVGHAAYLAGVIDQLGAAGSELAAIPAVTPHFCIDELLARSPLPVVNLLDVVAGVIRKRGLRRVALFGTRSVMETGMFGALAGVDLVALPPDALDLVHATYVQLARSGRGSPDEHASLTRLAKTLCARDGAEAVVLAGTDLALLFDESNTDFPCVDCAAAHIDAIMQAAR